MLRALAGADPIVRTEGLGLACRALGRAKPKSEELGPDGELLVEAALLSIARSVVAGGSLGCPEVAIAIADPCVPWVRCASGAPLTGHEPSNQDEPLCTKEELAPVVAKELARTPEDVLSGRSGTRSDLFAYATLVSATKMTTKVADLSHNVAVTDTLPHAFTLAHARRRYAIVQPREPACDSSLPLGTPCRCEEAVLRDHACRGSSVHPGLCKADVDDAQKKITNVATAISLQ
jgi:hypothetical protein